MINGIKAFLNLTIWDLLLSFIGGFMIIFPICLAIGILYLFVCDIRDLIKNKNR